MKLALGDLPLAIASGIAPENIRRYLPHADAFLVATGISRSFTELDPEKLETLMRHVNSNGDTPL
jgi:predicted TIM-barrel enzyme